MHLNRTRLECKLLWVDTVPKLSEDLNRTRLECKSGEMKELKWSVEEFE